MALATLVPLLIPGRAAADPAAELSGQIDARISGTRQTVDELRSTLAGGGLTAALRAGAIAAEHEEAVGGLPSVEAPATLEEAALSIGDAVRRAEAIVRNGPAADLPPWVGRVAHDVAVEGTTDPRAFRGMEPVSSVPALRAAALIARAVDAAAPALEAAVLETPGRAHVAAECDILEQEGLCVGGTGANTYRLHHVVTIDLGGNDTYLTDAGFVLTGAELVLDLGGDDLYAPPEGFGHGYGDLGGVGILVDGAGNDVYRSRSTTGDATGMGLGLIGGVGLMVDGAGNDTYEMTSEAFGKPAGAGGMGEAILGGVGVLVDGGGNDSYTGSSLVHPVRAKPTDPEDPDRDLGEVTRIGRSAVNVGGIGVFGAAGVMSDSGGTDTFSSESRIAAAPANWPPVEITLDPITGNPVQFAGVGGHGDGGLAGAGYLLTGPGPTVYRQRSVVESLPLDDSRMYVSHFGYGAAATGSVGVLSDAGGNDRYELDLSATSAVSRSIGDACTTPCQTPTASVSGPAFVATGQGYAAAGSVGLLEDAGGDDVYSAIVSESVSTSAEDLRTQAAQTSISGVATSLGAAYTGQGTGSLGGVGVVRDTLGNDRYELRATSSLSVVSSSTVPANEPDLFAQPGTSRSLGQGLAQGLGGVGAILDLGGSDAYTASAVSSVSDSGIPTAVQVLAQAAAAPGATGLGLALDLDGVSPDSYSTSPPVPVCQGTRGNGLWRDCGTHGIGLNV